MISIRWYNLYHDTFTSKLKNKDFKFKRFRTKYHYLFSRLEGEVHFLKHFPKTAMIYSYGLGSRTTAVLVHQGSPRTDLLLEAASWGQHIHSPVKQNCCCPRSQFITGLHLHFFQNYIFYLLLKKCFHSHLLSKNLKDSYIFYFDIVMSKWCDLLNQWK